LPKAPASRNILSSKEKDEDPSSTGPEVRGSLVFLVKNTLLCSPPRNSVLSKGEGIANSLFISVCAVAASKPSGDLVVDAGEKMGLLAVVEKADGVADGSPGKNADRR
jgi:hypothetical protein